MRVVSVSSSASALGETQWRSRSAATSRSRDASVRDDVETFTATASSSPRSRHRRAWASTRSSTACVSGRMSPALGNVDERAGGEGAALGMAPAHQRLHRGDRPGAHAHLGLEDDRELASGDALAQLVGERAVGPRVAALGDRDAVLAHALGLVERAVGRGDEVRRRPRAATHRGHANRVRDGHALAVRARSSSAATARRTRSANSAATTWSAPGTSTASSSPP